MAEGVTIRTCQILKNTKFTYFTSGPVVTLLVVLYNNQERIEVKIGQRN